MYEPLLRLIQLLVINYVDLLVTQRLGDSLNRLLITFRITSVQLVDLFQDRTGLISLRLRGFLLTLRNTAQRSHTHPEKLIQIIRVDAQETQPFQYRHLLTHRLLQDAPIEIHPTDVARKGLPFQYGCLNFLSCHIKPYYLNLLTPYIPHSPYTKAET